MLQVAIPCHPMSRKVLLAQYGAEPITLENQDPLFDVLTSSRIRPTAVKNRAALSSQITFALDDRIAQYVENNGLQIGHRLFRHHKPMLCWFVLGYFRAKGKGVVWGAIEEFLSIHEVDEDEYSTETAHKLFQRFRWNFDEKNARFSGRMRENPGVKMSRKKQRHAKTCKPVKPMTISMKDIEVELAIGRFLVNYSRCFSRTPDFLPKHARVYTYITMQKLSVRDAAQKLGMSRTGVQNALTSFRNRLNRNPTVSRLIEESIALPDRK